MKDTQERQLKRLLAIHDLKELWVDKHKVVEHLINRGFYNGNVTTDKIHSVTLYIEFVKELEERLEKRFAGHKEEGREASSRGGWPTF